MAKQYKCMGCSKTITVQSGKRPRKYHDYACYAKASAKVWGMTQKTAKAVAWRVTDVNSLLRSVGKPPR